MSTRTINIRILRWKPGAIDPPRFESFRVRAEEGATVLDALERIRREQDPGLMYRHSCHHGSCGTCACRVNGVERLACTTRLRDLGAGAVTLEPLRGSRSLRTWWSTCAASSPTSTPPGTACGPPSRPRGLRPGRAGCTVFKARRFEDCIECGACVSACPVDRAQPGFMGPAALAAVNAQRLKHPADEPAMLAIAGTRNAARPAASGRCAAARSARPESSRRGTSWNSTLIRFRFSVLGVKG